MQLPLTDPETLCEELLHDLPPATMPMARDFKAVVRPKKIKTPQPRLRLVFLQCGLDQSLREVAGTFTMLSESITDQAVAERLRAWGPWVQALLRRMFPMPAVATLPPERRFVVIDASRLHAPGATGTDHRLPSAMALRTLPCVEGLVRDVHPGATLQHLTLRAGDVALADRGQAPAQGMEEAVQQGADILVRLNPLSGVLCAANGQPRILGRALQRPPPETIRTLPVLIQASGGPATVHGWVQAYR